MKHLLVGVLFVYAFVLLGNRPIGQDRNSGSKQSANSNKNAPQQTPAPIQQTVHSGNDREKDHPTASDTGGSNPQITINAIPRVDVKKDWLDYATFGVGVLLIFVGLGTGAVIWYQSVQTKNAAKATQDSVKLQEIAYRQWVITDNWKVAVIRFDEAYQTGIADILFDIVNPTDFPLDLRNVTVRVIDGNSYSAPQGYRLAPQGRKSFPVAITLKDATPASTYSEVSFPPTIALINIWVEYESILGAIENDSFAWSFTLTTQKSAFIPLGLTLPKLDRQKTGKQTNPKEQRPN